MEHGNLRKWHIGLGVPILTAVLVWSYTQVEPAPNPRTTSPMMFEQALLSKPVGKSNPQPLVSNVRVYPPVDGLYLVNFDQLIPDRKNDAWIKQQWSFTARTPRNGSSEDVLAWLNRLSGQYPQAKFTYEWWRESKRLWMIWTGLSALLVIWGVVLPTVMWFVKGGYKEFKENAKAKPAISPALATASGPTAEDQDRLNEMIDNLEAQTAGASVGAGAATATGGVNTPAATAGGPRILAGKPLEALPDSGKPEEQKDYKGEFYPVARAGAPKKE